MFRVFFHQVGQGSRCLVSYTHLDVYKRQDEFRACCDELIIMSDDGSYGQKGVVTMPLEEKIKAGANFDEVITCLLYTSSP